MSEYKSPIKVTFEDISNEVINRYDNEIIFRVKKITGIDVDKKRLINALLLDKKLVKCKDCKHWKPEAVDNDDKHWRKLHVCGYWRRWYEKTNPCTRADDFCSKGERR